MTAVLCGHKISRLAISTSQWTPVLAPFAANIVTLRAADLTAQFKIRTDDTDAETEAQIYPSLEHTFGWYKEESDHASGDRFTRWAAGETICYVQAVGAPSTLILHWAR